MITTVLCYSATLGSSVADCGQPCKVDMGNVGLMSAFSPAPMLNPEYTVPSASTIGSLYFECPLNHSLP